MRYSSLATGSPSRRLIRRMSWLPRSERLRPTRMEATHSSLHATWRHKTRDEATMSYSQGAPDVRSMLGHLRPDPDKSRFHRRRGPARLVAGVARRRFEARAYGDFDRACPRTA